MKHLFDLTGKVAVITGGTGVLGSELSLGLARYSKGGGLVRIDRRDAVVEAIRQAGAKRWACTAMYWTGVPVSSPPGRKS